MSGIGAGGHFVRLNGRVYEALAARVERRPACDFYHSALQVEVAEGAFVIEQAPVRDLSGRQRGVVAEALSAVAGQADFESSATRFACGSVDTSQTSPRRWKARGD